jgi:vacuolar-type H+-ATPase subunit D/Vma8
MNLGAFKTRKDGAKKGYDLLKNKADALKVRNSTQEDTF